MVLSVRMSGRRFNRTSSPPFVRFVTYCRLYSHPLFKDNTLPTSSEMFEGMAVHVTELRNILSLMEIFWYWCAVWKAIVDFGCQPHQIAIIGKDLLFVRAFALCRSTTQLPCTIRKSSLSGPSIIVAGQQKFRFICDRTCRLNCLLIRSIGRGPSE